jgi:DNA (cytosine-5)-methyltransferase 1
MPDAGMCFAVLQPLPLPVPLAVRTVQTGANGIGVAEDVSHTLDGAQGQAIAFSAKDYGGDAGPLSPTLRSGTHDLSHANGGVMPAVAMSTVVRRLTPRECERLQGLPDDWTLVPYRGKPASDSPRYKAIGNGMAMPVLRWIGQRIAMVEGERNA